VDALDLAMNIYFAVRECQQPFNPVNNLTAWLPNVEMVEEEQAEETKEPEEEGSRL